MMTDNIQKEERELTEYAETHEPEVPKPFGKRGSEQRLHAIERLGEILGSINNGGRCSFQGKMVNTGVLDSDILWLWRVAHFYLRDEMHNIYFRDENGRHIRGANQAGITISDEEWEFFDKEDAKIPPQIKPKPVEPEQEPSVKGPKPVPPKNRVFKNERLVKDPDKPKKGFWHRLGIGK